MRKITGSVVFCEDIRRELNRQHTYVGVFDQVITIDNDKPAPIPLLSLAVSLEISTDFFGKSPMVRVERKKLNGEVSELSATHLPTIPHLEEKKTGTVKATIYFRIENAPLSANDRLSTTVTIDEETSVIGSIRVEKSDDVITDWEDLPTPNNRTL